jgi:hypothetical protein
MLVTPEPSASSVESEYVAYKILSVQDGVLCPLNPDNKRNETNGSQNPRSTISGLHEPILVYLSNLELIATFEGPKFALPKAVEDCMFPPLLQKLVKFLELFSSGLCVKCSLDAMNVGTASIWACWWDFKPKVQVSQEEQVRCGIHSRRCARKGAR